MNTVFVYGLLKPGFRLHHVVEPFVVRSTQATVRGRLYDARYPAARFDEDGEIRGYVLWVDPADRALQVLDEVEDEGSLYRRVSVTARVADEDVEAHAYEYLRSLTGSPFVGSEWSGAQGR